MSQFNLQQTDPMVIEAFDMAREKVKKLPLSDLNTKAREAEIQFLNVMIDRVQGYRIVPYYSGLKQYIQNFQRDKGLLFNIAEKDEELGELFFKYTSAVKHSESITDLMKTALNLILEVC